MNAFSNPTWELALREFLLHTQATRAAKTLHYYEVQVGLLARWAVENQIPFEGFGKRHLDRYLIVRQNEGKSQTTLHHDAICAKVFLSWCVKNDLLERSLLAEYEVRNAPRPPKYMPTEVDMRGLLQAAHDYWDTAKNPGIRFEPVTKRVFHRDRNYAVLLGLLDTACRIGEMLSLKVGDYDRGGRQITIRESKGRESRPIPVSREWADVLDVWLKVRARIMKDVPKEEDEGWVFLSEFNTRLDEGRFLKVLKRYAAFASASDQITLHSLRRYSLNRLAKNNILGAQAIAGHKETKTTLLYTRIDADFVRDIHEQVGVVRGIVSNSRIAAKKRRLI